MVNTPSFFRIFALYFSGMVLEVTFNVGTGEITFIDDTTQGSFEGTVLITHPDGFVSTVPIDNDTPNGEVAFRTDSEGNILQGDYAFVYTNDADVDESFEIDFCYTAPTLNLECKVDYLCSKLTVTDNTSYNIKGVSPANTSVSRSLTIAYPTGVGLDDIESSTVVTVVNPIYTGTFGIELSTVVAWNLGTHEIVDVLTVSKECVVDEGDSLCSLTCCMKESYKRWYNARCTNNRRASEFEEQFRRVSSIATLAYIGLSCGDVKGVEGYVAEAKKIAGCNDCDCEGGTGKLVVGLCGASTTGEVDVTGGDGITITGGGVISVDEAWLEAFVNNLISALDLSVLEAQVNQNSTDIGIAQNGVDAAFNQLNQMNVLLTNVATRFENHNILSFSYRFAWATGVLTDNRDAENRVVDAFVQQMNGTGTGGWVERPRVVWVNSPTSNAPAELEVSLTGIQSSLPLLVFNNLNVTCNLIGRGDATLGLGNFKPVIHSIGTGGENTVLRFRVRFWSENFGYVSQSFVSATTNNIGGNAHLSFFVTGKN